MLRWEMCDCAGLAQCVLARRPWVLHTLEKHCALSVCVIRSRGSMSEAHCRGGTNAPTKVRFPLQQQPAWTKRHVRSLFEALGYRHSDPRNEVTMSYQALLYTRGSSDAERTNVKTSVTGWTSAPHCQRAVMISALQSLLVSCMFPLFFTVCASSCSLMCQFFHYDKLLAPGSVFLTL